MTDDYQPRDDVVEEPITAIPPDTNFPDDDAIDSPSEDDATTAPEDPQA